MRALLFGTDAPEATARHRADALRRLGWETTQVDALRRFQNRLRGQFGRLHYHTGYRFLRQDTLRWLEDEIPARGPYDLCWIDGGVLFDRFSVRFLKSVCRRVVLFNHDDPSGPRDRRRFGTLRDAIREYDLCTVVRPFNVPEFRSLGAKDVLYTYRSYDEVAHAPVPGSEAPDPRFRSEVAFVGTNIPGEGRDRFLLQLADAGLDLAIWGSGWERSPLWPRLRPYVRGGAIAGRDYVDALRGARLCLGLLSRGNRDEHTTRTMEIPYAGGLLCAQRTAEHRALFEEGEEAVFWTDAQECISACRRLLVDEPARLRILGAGMKRVRSHKVGNEDLIRKAVDRVFSGA
jgi:spore maturation protein CgeB